jgi:hypothetical protein
VIALKCLKDKWLTVHRNRIQMRHLHGTALVTPHRNVWPIADLTT